jgi:hypothetical protein
LDLKLSINADYQQASKAFKELANESEATREKIEKFSASFQSEHLDKFIDRQKLLEVSLKGTRGEVESMTVAKKNYEKEIERLIKSGLDPESEAIIKLRNEHDKLANKIKETTNAQKAQEQALKIAEKATLALYAAIGAGITALGIATQKTAEAGDQYAKTARVIGMTAEAFQELNYAAKMSGIDNLEGSLQKLNKSISDLKNGSGTLTTYLKQNDQQLLNQLKNVSSNEEAFNLLMNAIKKAPNEFQKAGLAQAAFGKSGQELILLANEGAEGIATLREEARKYGVISNEAAANSEAYLDAQERLKTALSGISIELTSGLMPCLTNTINKIADSIASIDNWETLLKTAGIAIAGVTAALTTFIAVSKGHTIITAMAGAIKALQVAITGPAGAAALAIGALVTVGLALNKAYDEQQHAGERAAAAMRKNSDEAKTLLTNYNQLNPGKALDKKTTDELIKIYPELNGLIKENSATVEEATVAMKTLNEQKALDMASDYIKKIQNMTEETERLKKANETAGSTMVTVAGQMREIKNSYNLDISGLENSIQQAEVQMNAILEGVGKKYENGNIIDIPIVISEPESTKTTETINKVVDDIKKTLQQKLSDISLTPEQQFNEQIETVKSFLQQRADLERAAGEERIQAFQDELERIRENETLSNEEKYAAELATSEAIMELRWQMIEEQEKLREDELQKQIELDAAMKAEEEKAAQDEQKLLEQRISSFSTFFNGIGSLMEIAAEHSRGAAIASKAIASAEAAINSYLAFTKALASAPWPYNIVAAAGVLASGLAQQIKIISTPIPSAETGGRFIVPNAVGSDSQLMRVNPGEEVEVTPRGMIGSNENQHITVQIEKQTIFDVINDGIRSGDVLISAANF